MIYLPLVTTPVGWLILGLGGYALYRKGKKNGSDEAAASCISAVPPQIEANTISTKGEK